MLLDILGKGHTHEEQPVFWRRTKTLYLIHVLETCRPWCGAARGLPARPPRDASAPSPWPFHRHRNLTARNLTARNLQRAAILKVTAFIFTVLSALEVNCCSATGRGRDANACLQQGDYLKGAHPILVLLRSKMKQFSIKKTKQNPKLKGGGCVCGGGLVRLWNTIQKVQLEWKINLNINEMIKKRGGGKKPYASPGIGVWSEYDECPRVTSSESPWVGAEV